MEFLLLINLLVSLCTAGVVVREESNYVVEEAKVLNIKVNQILPRHQCRRALRNLEVIVVDNVNFSFRFATAVASKNIDEQFVCAND